MAPAAPILLLLLFGCTGSMAAYRPNIVVILGDDLVSESRSYERHPRSGVETLVP